MHQNAAPEDYSADILDGDVRNLVKQITGQETAVEQLFSWENKIHSSKKGNKAMCPFLDGLWEASRQLTLIGATPSSNTI